MHRLIQNKYTSTQQAAVLYADDKVTQSRIYMQKQECVTSLKVAPGDLEILNRA